MRCSCQICGEYMVQDEKGLSSRCICPNCFNTCSACMGTSQKPLEPDQLRGMLARRAEYDEELKENGKENGEDEMPSP